MSNFLKGRKSKLYQVYNLLSKENHLKFESCTFSPDGTYALICNNQRIFKLCMKSEEVSIFAGNGSQGSRNGPKEQASFQCPGFTIFSPDGKCILVSDTHNYCIRQICTISGKVSTFAGIPGDQGDRNGAKEQATFRFPKHLTFSPGGNYVYVCDSWNHSIRRICVVSGEVSTYAESVSGLRTSIFRYPSSVRSMVRVYLFLTLKMSVFVQFV